MKKLILLLILFTASTAGFANHIKGGFFTYTYKGPGISDPSKLRYDITLTVYMSCDAINNPQQLNDAYFSFFNTTNNNLLETVTIPRTETYLLQKSTDEPCISGDQRGCYYTIVIYRLLNKELTPLSGGYTVSYQRCCRIANMENVDNSSAAGNTFTVVIPGLTTPFSGQTNSSPNFPINDTAVVCENSFFRLPFLATDPDGDSLSYSLCGAYTGASSATPAPTVSTAPPYTVVPYTFPYTGAQPLGSLVSIDPRTGLISGIAPQNVRGSGEYVICVCVKEYRNGIQIAETRKELHIKVGSCVPLNAQLNPQYISCDGFTLTFSNTTPSSAITSHFWDFGVPSITNDTSILETPTYTYPDTGTFVLTLIVNKGQPCTDSAKAIVKVYPGFFPGFISTGICKGAPIQFTDTTKTKYGVVNAWSWNFGDPNTLADTSHAQNPVYNYPNPGTYTVTLTVSNSKGCTKIITKQITVIDRPVITMAFKDSSYCGKDTLGLGASASVPSTYSWTPLTNIINPNSANPQVYPTSTTTYVVTADAGGCIAKDSVTVQPKNDLAATATANPAAICQDDTLALSGTTNHAPVTWAWSPAASVLNPAVQSTKAFPQANTTYTLTVRWGNNCVATDSKPVTVKPLAIANAGPPAYICAGQTSAQLNASGGDNYQWTPTTGLSNPNIANPLASPATTTTYTVSVGINGCTGRRKDSVTVEVKPAPALTVSPDTLICNIDTLQIFANGSGSVFWTPNYNISSQTSPNPLVSPNVTTVYRVTLTDQFGCTKKDSVKVNVTPSVNVFAGNDTTICQTDAIQFNTISNGLNFSWTPVTGLNNAGIKNPVARPDTTTTYKVFAAVGKCNATDEIKVSVAPYPVANAGPDTAFCFGNRVQLQASGGDVYLWNPATFLDNPNIPNPIAFPTQTTRYVVSVRSTTSGCPKAVRDTILITVYPKVIADAGPRDTVIVKNQPLQLNGSGGLVYTWSPSTGLNNPNIKTPVAVLGNDMQYILKVTSDKGCTGTDTIDVIVYKVEPDLFVPTAFTPNGDGKNDYFRPIPIGMKRINYFKVFNRWGVLMFSSPEMKGRGWDGSYAGKPQDPDTFVWIVQGTDYEDKTITKKGYVVLIR